MPEPSGLTIDLYPEVYQDRVDHLQILAEVIPALEIEFLLIGNYIMHPNNY